MDEDWYRTPDWDEDARAAFEKRLSRSRSWTREQYLRIKALALIEAGELRVAEELLRRALGESGADEVEHAFTTEVLADLKRKRGDLVQAEHLYRELLSRWPDMPMTTYTVEVSLAEVLVQRDDAAAHEEAGQLIDAYLSRDMVQWPSDLFRVQLVRIRLAELMGDAEVAAESARLALFLAAEEPVVRGELIGVVRTDEFTLARLRALAATGA